MRSEPLAIVYVARTFFVLDLHEAMEARMLLAGDATLAAAFRLAIPMRSARIALLSTSIAIRRVRRTTCAAAFSFGHSCRRWCALAQLADVRRALKGKPARLLPARLGRGLSSGARCDLGFVLRLAPRALPFKFFLCADPDQMPGAHLVWT
jgi:hypothetical protein